MLTGLVLAGGASRRMGTDKAFLDFHQKPQYQYLFDLLKTCTDTVMVSCRPEQGIPQSYNPVYDAYDFGGPVNGILSAWQMMPDAAFLVVPCDMPGVDEIMIKTLISEWDLKAQITYFQLAGSSFPEPLPSIWTPEALRALEAFCKTSQPSLVNFISQKAIHTIHEKDRGKLVNINTEAALKIWKDSN